MFVLSPERPESAAPRAPDLETGERLPESDYFPTSGDDDNDSTISRSPVPNVLSQLLMGFRSGLERKVAENQRESIHLRALSIEELAESGEGSKLNMVARLCTKGMFGEDDGVCWVLRNFNIKYGGEGAAGRQSVMLVAETSKGGEIIGCVGMELMQLTDQGMAWWANPSSMVKKRPFVSDLVVDPTYRQRGVGRDLLRKCHDIVTGEWAERIRALTPAERLDFDLHSIFLKVDAENTAAVSLYLGMGYKEVKRVSEELMVPKADGAQEWPVLNIYMQRHMHL
eukprot:CAMPEP_0179420512 /NCGR_PEP_ID=MMETSP0799-20121207/9212_1 /TAXON_ID=46947 /ORGANISM="Geminigera cryophila, Strain CCMP2564" /LENGTH=282 /DNA_ID=CAMNT_0021194137 /DNA_START=132 /DNA_END=984 /DNA_ORIENTATION=+